MDKTMIQFLIIGILRNISRKQVLNAQVWEVCSDVGTGAGLTIARHLESGLKQISFYFFDFSNLSFNSSTLMRFCLRLGRKSQFNVKRNWKANPDLGRLRGYGVGSLEDSESNFLLLIWIDRACLRCYFAFIRFYSKGTDFKAAKKHW